MLIIEDDNEIAGILELHLRSYGAMVQLVENGDQGMKIIEANNWDLVILDIKLPGLNGLELCKNLRLKKIYVPIIILSSQSTELDHVLGFDVGADDYITKPFSVLEVISRIKALFRRINHYCVPTSEKLGQATLGFDTLNRHTVGEICIDETSHGVWVSGNSVELTNKEFDLLLHFVRNPGRVFSRSELLDTVWGYGHVGYEHTVNSHINRLRTKIEIPPNYCRYIVTVWGVGYKLIYN